MTESTELNYLVSILVEQASVSSEKGSRVVG